MTPSAPPPGSDREAGGAPLRATHAGVVVRFTEDGARDAGVPEDAWIPASVARRVAFASSTTALAIDGGVTLGLALVEGRLLTLVGVGPVAPRSAVVLCSRGDADAFALAVDAISASGRFDEAGDDAVLVEGRPIERLDLDDLWLRLEAAFWIEGPRPERFSIVPRSRSAQGKP